ncbi:hypothetical protein chiPu_0010475 [Chiloscyllium punctatum]|uniref:Uncharacterized protein n=1 Tax=Chiloscyllium punctatum TaxID=137246 RepID=A0A401SNP0_CHIPU|nr:hypothetical protein [Chiloscyllium punctatum]
MSGSTLSLIIQVQGLFLATFDLPKPQDLSVQISLRRAGGGGGGVVGGWVGLELLTAVKLQNRVEEESAVTKEKQPLQQLQAAHHRHCMTRPRADDHICMGILKDQTGSSKTPAFVWRQGESGGGWGERHQALLDVRLPRFPVWKRFVSFLADKQAACRLRRPAQEGREHWRSARMFMGQEGYELGDEVTLC